MTKLPLFRTAAVQASKSKWLGSVVLIRPLTLTLLTSFAGCIAFAFTFFLAFGSYTRRISVSGQLLPDSGVIKVHVPQPGLVVQRLVSEGQTVKQGDILYWISWERQTGNLNAVQAEVSHQVAARRQSLHEELAQLRQLQEGRIKFIHGQGGGSGGGVP